MTPQKEQSKRNHMFKNKSEKSSAVRKSSQTWSTTPETSLSTNPPSASSVAPSTKTTSMGRANVSINAAAGNLPGGDGACGGFCDPERW